jgi:hypothetical protein
MAPLCPSIGILLRSTGDRGKSYLQSLLHFLSKSSQMQPSQQQADIWLHR